MCGIVAAIGKPSQQLHNVFQLMLSVGITRGKDSTGIAVVNNNNQVNIVKGVMFPLELLRTQKYKRFVIDNEETNHTYIGHNRAATQGQVIGKNAHPFKHGNITLVHNGTLIQDPVTTKKGYGTDSEAICLAISEKGIDEVWEELYGAAVLVYYDTVEESTFVISNGKRPLLFKWSKNRNSVFFGSEQWIIDRTCKHLNVTLEDKIYFPDDNTLFKFSFDQKTNKINKTFRELKPRVEKTFVSSLLNSSWYSYGYSDNSKGGMIKLDNNKGNKVKLDNIDKDERDRFTKIALTKKEFARKYPTCYYCNNDLNYLSSVIIDSEIALCQDCVGWSMVGNSTMLNDAIPF